MSPSTIHQSKVASVFPNTPGPGWFGMLAGGLLAFNGTAALLAALGNSELLQINDPVFNLPTRWVMLLFAILELIVALHYLFSRQRTLSRWLLLWLTVNLAVYRIGGWSAGWPHPYSYLGQMMHSLNLSPLRADIFMASMLLLLFSGGMATLLLERKTDLAKRFQKMSCPACGRHIKFAVESLGQKIPCPQCQTTITLRKPEETLKISCFFCKEHIEFPSHAIGEKMPCPHCKMDITLKEPA